MRHDIKLKTLSLKKTKVIYEERMREDFPPAELKKLQLICELFEKGLYEGFGVFEGENLLGYAYFSMDNDHRFYLMDYFAIKKELRGQGYGSDMLQLITEHYKAADALICEVENPFLEEDYSLRQEKQRRMEFYRRSGWNDTGIDAWMYGVEYRILSAKASRHIEPEGLLKAYELIYRSVIENREELERNMRLRMN